MNLKNSPGKKISPVLLIGICSSLLLLLIVKGPAPGLIREARDLQDQLRLVGQKKEELLSIMEETAHIHQETGLSSTEQAPLASSIPLEKDLPLALASLEEMVEQYPLHLKTLKAAQKNLQGVTGTMEVELALSGPTGKIDLFLNRISSLPHLFTLDSITWSKGGEDEDIAELVLILEFYYIDPHELDPGIACRDFQ